MLQGADNLGGTLTSLEVENSTAETYVCAGKVKYYDLKTGNGIAFGSTDENVVPNGRWSVLENSRNAYLSGYGTGPSYVSIACELHTPDTGTGGAVGTPPAGEPPVVPIPVPASTHRVLMTGSVGYAFSGSLSTVALRASDIYNESSSRTTNSLSIELWGTTSAAASLWSPNLMANTLKLASAPVFIGCAPLGALAPASRCTNIELEATLNPPPAGSYIVSLVLLEGGVACPPSAFGVTGAYESGDGRCVRAWRRFTDKLDFSASGETVAAEGLQITAPVSYTMNYSASTAQLQIAELRNLSKRSTGTLRLNLWATSTPYAGGAISGYRVLDEPMPPGCAPQLMSGAGCASISITSAISARPPAGNYFLTLVVAQYEPDNCVSPDGYCIASAKNFEAAATFPPVSGSTNESDVDTGGGGGSGRISFGLLIGLLLIAWRRSGESFRATWFGGRLRGRLA